MSQHQNEADRLFQMLSYERLAAQEGYGLVAGIDEAGRGPLAGPVVAAACILPSGFRLDRIDDSKKLSPLVRSQLYAKLTSDPTILYGVGIVSAEEVDALNIYQATIKAMLQAVEELPVEPDFLLVDGLKLPHSTIPCKKIIKGDQLSQSIAAASIIAKVTRDEMMEAYDQQYPEYGFLQHKGYGTLSHRRALTIHGRCPIHRKTFKFESVDG